MNISRANGIVVCFYSLLFLIVLVPAGMYMYKITVGEFSAVKKLLLLK